jgi:hypothetical protein
MSNLRRTSVISSFIAVLLLWVTTLALAAPVATVTHVSGPIAVRKSDGNVKSISIGSKIDDGDTVVTEKRTYARLKFTDGSEVTLKPGSQFLVEAFSFDQEKPQEDNAVLRLIKGGLRTVTGQVGKRGNQDKYQMKTPGATIGIRGTMYEVSYYPEGSEDDDRRNVPPGLYLVVTDGSVVISNSEGKKTSLAVSAGQYVYVKDATTPPVFLPTKPDITFNPPAALGFSGGTQGHENSYGSTNCEMR